MSSADPQSDLQAVEQLHRAHARIKSEIGKVIIGQDKVIEQLLIALLS
jgi:MoxR-like ATPase